ncbi:MAG: hypothetical protein RLZZ458_2707, partial [Planctomycetota bacterium]
MSKPNVKSAIIKLSGKVNPDNAQELYLDVDGLQNGATVTIFGESSANQVYVWQGPWDNDTNSRRKKKFNVKCVCGYSGTPFGAGDVIDVTITVQNPGSELPDTGFETNPEPERSSPFQSVI